MERTREYTWTDPVALAETGRSLRGIEFMRAVADGSLPPMPIAATLGFELSSVEPGSAVCTFTPGEQHYNAIGCVHGGVYAVLLDTAVGCALQTTLDTGEHFTSLDLAAKFLRPMTAQTGPVRATGSVINRGR